MITETAKKRIKILIFWKKHGPEAVEEAFGVKVRTLFEWQRRLKEGGGKLEALNPKSRSPKQKRKRIWPVAVLEEIKRIRGIYPNLGKEKIYPLLEEFCQNNALPCPKPKTIGRLIKDMGGLRKVPQRITGTGRIKPIKREPVMRKPKDFKAEYPGHLVGLDTIEEHIHGCRRYVITAEDIFGRFAFAWATCSHASKAAKEFFHVFLKLFPYPVTFVLTDNGSEFKKDFSKALLKLQIDHFHTYPKQPKMNAHIERFNRTLQEEFLNYHKNLLLDPDDFNRKLMDYLIFYNTKRVHYAFNNRMTPVQFLLQWGPADKQKKRLPVECKKGWPYTHA